MKTRHFLTIATLAVGMAMTCMMMTSCAKEDNPIDNATDGPNVLPAGVILENKVPCQIEDYGGWRDYSVRMQYRVIDKLYQGKYPAVELISINSARKAYKIFIPDSVVGYWGEEYKVSKIKLQDFEFYRSGLVELHMNNHIPYIEENFEGCTNLKKLYLPEGVQVIWDNAFKGCTSLEEIHLPSSLRYIGEHAFDGCENLKYAIFNVKKIHNNRGWFSEGVEFFTEEQWEKKNPGTR